MTPDQIQFKLSNLEERTNNLAEAIYILQEHTLKLSNDLTNLYDSVNENRKMILNIINN